MQLNDLLPLWQKQALQKELGLVRDLEKAFSALKNTDGEYARAMSQMIESRKRVVDLWRKEISGAPGTKALVEKAKECVAAWHEWADDETQHFPSDEWLNSMEELEEALSRLQGGKNGN